MKLRVSHFPQVPCKPFKVDVKSLEEALFLLDVLADYDLFQYNNNIKPDYANATFLQCWDEEEKEWLDWCDEDGNSIDELGLDGIARLKENL